MIDWLIDWLIARFIYLGEKDVEGKEERRGKNEGSWTKGLGKIPFCPPPPCTFKVSIKWNVGRKKRRWGHAWF